MSDLVTREEIRAELWPATLVEFDTSLHFCVRQLRAALGDTAAASRYIETLPRRGYRLVPAVEASRARAERRPLRPRLAAAVIAMIGTGLIATALLRAGHTDPLRIGVMPFEPPAESAWAGEISTVAEWILEDLAVRSRERAGIVGPTSTAPYATSDADLRRLAADYKLQYIVNGRFIEHEDGARMLAELIRVSDGVHLWVRRFDDLSDGRRVGLEISRNVARELGL